jgi:hypothetical protein
MQMANKLTPEQKFFRCANRVDPELARHVWEVANRAIDLGVDVVTPDQLHSMPRSASFNALSRVPRRH